MRSLLVLVCAGGLAVSVYLTTVHYADAPLFCSSNGTVDCSAVLHSRYATIAGLPVSIGGIVWFALMAALGWWDLRSRIVLAWIAIGIATVMWLVFVELAKLEHICIWCTVAHALVLACVGIVLVASARAEDGQQPDA